MKKTERNEDRELTVVLIVAFIIFGTFFLINAWLLPSLGIRT
ncbi:MAG: hypothetical protein WDA74_00400 [Spirochaetota bacterium]|jgi:hypothetical protein